MQERIEQFDIMKAVAIYLVVVGHMFYRMSWNVGGTIIFLHMPVFFFVSGYFAEKSLEKYETWMFCKKKIVSLLIPYIVWSGISLAANTVSVFKRVCEQNLFWDWLLGESIDIFIYARSVWFLIALFFAQLFYAFVRKIRSVKGAFILYLLLWIAVASVLPNKALAFNKIKWLFPFLLCGGWIASVKKIVKAEKWQVIICSVLFIGLSIFLYEEKTAEIYSNFLYTNAHEAIIGMLYYMISFLGIWCLYQWSVYIAKLDFLKKKICIIGKNSLDIYVTHMLMIKFFFIMPGVIQQNKLVAHIYVFSYALIIIVCITFVSEKYLKNVKLYNLSLGRWTEKAKG